MTSAALTPAASAIVRSPTPNPRSPNCSIAASRIRAAAVRSAERMFSTLNARSAERQGGAPSRIRKSWPADAKAPDTPCVRGLSRLLAQRKLVADGGQQPVAQRHQRGRQPLILGDEPGRLAH